MNPETGNGFGETAFSDDIVGEGVGNRGGRDKRGPGRPAWKRPARIGQVWTRPRYF